MSNETFTIDLVDPSGGTAFVCGGVRDRAGARDSAGCVLLFFLLIFVLVNFFYVPPCYSLSTREDFIKNALVQVHKVVASGGKLLVVSTKKQASEQVSNLAKETGQFFVNYRWLGGMLTNWNTIQNSIISCFVEFKIKHGFDVGLEMSGNPQAFNDMLSNIYHGGKIVLLGLLPKETIINWDNIIFKGLHVRGVYGREMYETWYKMDQLIKGGLDLSKIITHKFKC